MVQKVHLRLPPKSMIPAKLHQVWIGDLPKQYELWCAQMKEMNPRWQHRLWRDEVLELYKDDPIVAWMLGTNEKAAFIVDRIRVLLLRDFGGVYLDADCQPVRPLDSITLWGNDSIDFVAAMRNPDRSFVTLTAPGVAFVDNTFLASALDGRMAHRLCNLYTAVSRKHTGMSQGREILRNADETTALLNWRYFYAEKEDPLSIVLHDGHNAGTWFKPAP